MTKLVLLRHGRSEANAAGILAGRTPGVALDEEGRSQAQQVAEMLRDVDVRAVHTSPSQRCRETAAHLHAPAPVVEPGLDECDYGEWSGRELKDLAGEPLWATIQSRPSTVTFPAGESMAALSGRAVAAARSVVTGHDGGVVVAVSHGDVIKAILADALAMDFDDFQRLHVAPASLSVVDYGGERPLVLCVNGGTDVAAQLRSTTAPSVGGGDVAHG